jgi:predicted CoA-binding protein
MAYESCPLPSVRASDEQAAIRRMLNAKRIAIVGLSDNPARASHEIAEYLIGHGYDVVGVNPNLKRVLGRECYASLKDVPGKIDVVNVFRRPEHCAAVAREAAEIGAKGLWLQLGIANAEARKIAIGAGMNYIENRCILVEHRYRGT